MYIYEQKCWPNFLWDQEAIAELLVQLRYKQGRLIGAMESIGFQLREETILQTLTQDVVKSSEIEGVELDQSLVRSYVARHLGMDVAGLNKVDRSVEGVVDMMLDATQNFSLRLTKTRVLSWHSSLFPKDRRDFSKIRVGEWRVGPVEVISGHMGKEVVHFEGPPANRVEREMKGFLEWLDKADGTDLVLKAALAHLWFVTIHPFEGGNGRIGRAIADLLLARSEHSSQRFYSLSAQIQLERKSYYDILESTQKGSLDVTPWIKWFFRCLTRAIETALINLDGILYKTKFWESLANTVLNDRQKKIINCLLDGFEGKLTTSKWAKITKCSQDTAYRDILNLVEKGILRKNLEGGRSTSYSLVN